MTLNLHNVVSAAINAVNPNVPVVIQASTGNAVTDDGEQVPSYSAPVTMMAQVQALTTQDLMQLDGLDIQGSTHTLYISDPLNGVVRSTNKGGDLVTTLDPRTSQPTATYLITAVLEQWPLWTRALATLQSP